MFLALAGRDRARLHRVGANCRHRGAAVDTTVLEVSDSDGMARWIARVNRRARLDLVIANAGVGAGAGAGIERPPEIRRVFATNLDGTLNTVLPAMEIMLKRRGRAPRGQIAIMASMAGLRGLGVAPAYSASKAALLAYGESLAAALRPHGIEVTVILPGFVESRMTKDRLAPMPLLMSAERAAVIIRRGLARGRRRVAFPLRLYVLALALAHLPPWFLHRVLMYFRSG